MSPRTTCTCNGLGFWFNHFPFLLCRLYLDVSYFSFHFQSLSSSLPVVVLYACVSLAAPVCFVFFSHSPLVHQHSCVCSPGRVLLPVRSLCSCFFWFALLIFFSISLSWTLWPCFVSWLLLPAFRFCGFQLTLIKLTFCFFSPACLCVQTQNSVCILASNDDNTPAYMTWNDMIFEHMGKKFR